MELRFLCVCFIKLYASCSGWNNAVEMQVLFAFILISVEDECRRKGEAREAVANGGQY